MVTRESSYRIALYIDLENFVGFCNGLGLLIDLAPEISRLTELGKVTVRRSFGDIYKMPMSPDRKMELRKMLQNNLIYHEDVPYHNNYKNTSDIRLVIDALSTAYTNEDIDMVAVVASDRDYLPLFSKLREIGKEVIGIGGNRDNTPELFVKACDYFFYHEALTGGAPGAALGDGPPEQHSVTQVLRADDVISLRPGGFEATRLLVESIKVDESRGLSSHSGSRVIQTMRRLKPDFDLASYGYANFKQLCEQAEKEGLIEIEHHGVIFNLNLAVTKDATEQYQEAQAAAANDEAPDCKSLKEWVELKMRTPFPTYDERVKIYCKLADCLQNVTEENGIALDELARRISADCSLKTIQQSCYKVLYSLYRSNLFLCSPGATSYNPVINGLKRENTPATMDACFIENTLRVYMRECRSPIEQVKWSEVFFGSPQQAGLIKDIARNL